MIYHRITFGTLMSKKRDDEEQIIWSYLASLRDNGQISSQYSFVHQKKAHVAYVHAAGIHAHQLKYHSDYGRRSLEEVRQYWGREPVWELIDDDAPKRDTLWTNAPFLYLFTHFFDGESPVVRGDTGRQVPVYRIPGDYELRRDIVSWYSQYQDFDTIWMNSGALEIQAYKELAIPDSDLSKEGRDICKRIEKATGVPTYYYLYRYFGRRQNEDKRRCPGCGKKWRTKPPADAVPDMFWHFQFQCKSCRLVSHVSYDESNERYASYGEWKVPKGDRK